MPLAVRYHINKEKKKLGAHGRRVMIWMALDDF